jgi:hypothetical protein
VAAERGTLTDTSYLEAAISSLGNRVFLLHNVHSPKPLLFHTRWALSYLYGPMTRDHVAAVMATKKAALTAPIAAAGPGHATIPVAVTRHCAECKTPAPAQAHFCMNCGTQLPAVAEVPLAVAAVAASGGAAGNAGAGPATVPPVLPPGLTQFFVPTLPLEGEPAALLFQPRLLGFAEVVFNDRKHKLEYRHVYRLLSLPPDAVHPEPWFHGEEIPETLSATAPAGEALWAEVPETLNDPKKLRKLEQALVYFLHKNAALTIYHNRFLGLLSKPQEDRAAFLGRCQEAAKTAAAEELAAPAEQPAEMAAVGANGDSPAVPPPARSAKASPARAARVEQKWQKKAEDIREIQLTPRKLDIRVTHFGLAWAPFKVSEAGSEELVAAYERRPIPAESWRSAATPTDVGEA